METKFLAKQSIELEVPPSEVWHALTDPEEIKKYFFDTNTITDWKVGSTIVFKGEWDGRSYEDKGTILEFIPEKKLVYNYWSSISATEDIPENYATIIYQLTPIDNGNGTLLEVTQDGITSEAQKKDSETNWRIVLEQLKETLYSYKT